MSIKVYTYTRVSTAMQVEGYSLEAQKERIERFAKGNDFEIVRTYEDAGKSGKSIEGRTQFLKMIEDIKSNKDGVSFVLVFKLSRFGRSAADVLSTLQVMQDYGVNLICVDDGIDSSKGSGKLIISVLSAVAEIERENIRAQTLEGRMQKAREGRWNGGFAPYGYELVEGKLQVNEKEAEAIRIIFDKYVNTDMGATAIAKYLENQGIRKIPRQNGKNPLFDASLIRRILRNEVYCGKIAFGKRRTEKVKGTRDEYRQVPHKDYIVVDGIHEGLVSEETWNRAQGKLDAMAKKYQRINRQKGERIHLLSGIIKCPVCGAGMYGNKTIKKRPDGTKYKDYYFYGCKHRKMERGHACDYRKQINEELIDNAVREVICQLVSKPSFAEVMQKKINPKIDTAEIDKEIENYEKELKHQINLQIKLSEEMDALDIEGKHYERQKRNLNNRLLKSYDLTDEIEGKLKDSRSKKIAIEKDIITEKNIFDILTSFDTLYEMMDETERRELVELLIEEIQIYEERQANGQWLKSVKFKLPIIPEDMVIGLDNNTHGECVVLMSKAST